MRFHRRLCQRTVLSCYNKFIDQRPTKIPGLSQWITKNYCTRCCFYFINGGYQNPHFHRCANICEFKKYYKMESRENYF